MNKTKIIASINQDTYQKNTMQEMIINGVDAVCLDSSISDYNFIKNTVKDIKEINKKINTSISTILILEESFLKTGKFKNGKAELRQADRIRIHMSPKIGSEVGFSVNHPSLIHSLKAHTIIKLSKGKVLLEVQEIGLDYAVCEVIKGGEVCSDSRIYIPGISIERDYNINKIKDEIIFASNIDVDYVVLPSVREEEDILKVNDLLIQHQNNHIGVLAQIENDIAVKNAKKIIDASDGIILNEDNLAINIPIEKIPIIKKDIIIKARKRGKLSIITSKLEKIQSPLEISNLANSILLGVDAISLKVIANSVEIIKDLEKVISIQEKHIDYEQFFNEALKTEANDINAAIISSAIRSAFKLNCKAIVIQDDKGLTSKKISKFKPKCPIIAIVPNERVDKILNVYYGIISVSIKGYTFGSIVEKAKCLSQKILDLKDNDTIIIVEKNPVSQKINSLKIEEI